MAKDCQLDALSPASVPTVVINLERDKARLVAVAAEFARQDMAFQRFAAVEGLAVPDSLRDYFFDGDGRPAARLTKGEIGCYASHLSVWQRVACGPHPVTLVCEDDIRLPDQFQAVLAAALAAAPAGWDVIRLSAPSKRTLWPVGRICDRHRLVHYSKIPPLLGAYLISQRGARKLLRPGLRARPVDLDMARPWETGLHLYGIDPAPVYQPTRNASSIDRVEKRHYARRATGFLGIRSRLFGRDRFRRYRHNVRTVGVWRAMMAEVRNLFRGRQHDPAGARHRSDPQPESRTRGARRPGVTPDVCSRNTCRTCLPCLVCRRG
jgi:glycosyl transferase family 25